MNKFVPFFDKSWQILPIKNSTDCKHKTALWVQNTFWWKNPIFVVACFSSSLDSMSNIDDLNKRLTKVNILKNLF